MLDVEEAQRMSREKLYDVAASRIGSRLHQLKVQVDRLAHEQAMHVHRRLVRSEEQAAGILQQVDWELFGMRSYLSIEDDSSLRQETEIPARLDVECSQQPASLSQETEIQPRVNVDYSQEFASHNWCSKVNGHGIVSRMPGYIDPTELMGFAARGLFMNLRSKELYAIHEVGPVKAWKQFFEANLFQQWNYC